MIKSKRLHISIATIIFLLLVYGIFQIDKILIEKIIENLKAIGYVAFFSAFLFSILQCLFQGERFTVLGKRNHGLSRHSLHFIFYKSQLLNQLLIVRAGEVYKILSLKFYKEKRQRLSGYEAFATVAVERIITILSLILLGFIARKEIINQLQKGIFSHDLPFAHIIWGIVLLLVITIVFLISKKLWGFLINLGKGFFPTLNTKRIILSFIISIGSWIAEYLALYFLLIPFDIYLGLKEGIMVLLLLNLSLLVPITFGNIGFYETAIAVVLVSIGVPLPTALSVAIVHHILQYLAIATLLLIFWLGQSKEHKNLGS